MKKFLLLGLCLVFAFGCCKKSCSLSVAQKLKLNIPSDPDTLDPRKGGDRVSSVMHFLLFDGLMRMDDTGAVSNALASHVEISEDKTVYTFTLRDCFWSDGSPITAWDFEKSWKDILRPDFPSMNAHLLYPIKNAEGAKRGSSSLAEVGIRCLDTKTLEVTLERPTPYFLDLVAFCVFFPINAELDHLHPDWEKMAEKKLTCSGPFIIKEWRRNNVLVLAKNPHYYRADIIALQEIQFSVVDNEMTSLHLFEKGELDIIGQPLMSLPSDAIPELIKKNLLQVHPVAATTFCTFNVGAYPFNNQNIRKAFSYAINRGQIVGNITQLSEIPALNVIPPILKKGVDLSFFKDADIENARRLFEQGLAELKITKEEFPPVKCLYMKAELHHKIAQALQQQWFEALGVSVEIENVERNILLSYLKHRNYQVALSWWIAQYQDSMNLFERFKFGDNVKNYSNWQNNHFSSLLNRSSEVDTEQERYALLHQAEQILMDEMPIAPIFHWNSAFIAKPYVRTFGPAQLGNGFYDRVYIDLEAKENRR